MVVPPVGDPGRLERVATQSPLSGPGWNGRRSDRPPSPSSGTTGVPTDRDLGSAPPL